MDRPSLARQVAAIKHAIIWAGQNGLSESVRADAEHGVTSLEFLRDHDTAFKALHRILATWPDARIEEYEHD